MNWSDVPLPIWIIFGAMGAWSFVLMVGWLRATDKINVLKDDYDALDRDLATAEKKIEKLVSSHSQLNTATQRLQEQCADLARPVVRPGVPTTNPIERQREGGRHNALDPPRRRLPPVPRTTREIRAVRQEDS